jgi:hypothetical protein
MDEVIKNPREQAHIHSQSSEISNGEERTGKIQVIEERSKS